MRGDRAAEIARQQDGTQRRGARNQIEDGTAGEYDPEGDNDAFREAEVACRLDDERGRLSNGRTAAQGPRLRRVAASMLVGGKAPPLHPLVLDGVLLAVSPALLDVGRASAVAVVPIAQQTGTSPGAGAVSASSI
jgi:hypothetical protein